MTFFSVWSRGSSIISFLYLRGAVNVVLNINVFLLLIHFFHLSRGKLYTNILYCVPSIVFPLLLIVYYCCSLVLSFVLLIPITIFLDSPTILFH